jgi:hypothetical protein
MLVDVIVSCLRFLLLPALLRRAFRVVSEFRMRRTWLAAALWGKECGNPYLILAPVRCGFHSRLASAHQEEEHQ